MKVKAGATALLMAATLAVTAGCNGEDDLNADGRVLYGFEFLNETATEQSVVALTYEIGFSNVLTELIYNGLVELDPTDRFEPKPGLAKSWSVSDDGLVYTFELRDDVRWHDGEPFDAEDVKFTYDAVLDPQNAAPAAASLTELREVTVIDPHTVEFRLGEVSAPFIKKVSLPIHPEHLLGQELASGTQVKETDYAKQPVGTGPFIWTQFARGESLTFEANEDYFEGPPSLEEVVLVSLSDPTAAVARLRTGEIEAAGRVPGKQLPRLEEDERYTISEQRGVLIYTVALNTREPLFADPAVRIALSQFVDRQALIDAIEGGIGTAATSPLQNTGWETDAGARLASDPEAGARTLEGAGWEKNADGVWEKDGRTLSFTLVDGFFPQQAQLVTSAWRDQGIDVTLKTVDGTELEEQLATDPGQFQAVTWSHGSAMDPDLSLRIVYHSADSITEGGGNVLAYENDAADGALDRGRASLDESERRAAYREFEEVVAADPPYVLLHAAPVHFVVSNAIAGPGEGIPEYYEARAVFHNIEDWRVDD